MDQWLFPNETLTRGAGTCREYAHLSVSMLIFSGYIAYVVAGNVSSDVFDMHAWIAIQLNGTLYHFEPQVTWAKQPKATYWAEHYTAQFFYDNQVFEAATDSQNPPLWSWESTHPIPTPTPTPTPTITPIPTLPPTPTPTPTTNPTPTTTPTQTPTQTPQPSPTETQKPTPTTTPTTNPTTSPTPSASPSPTLQPTPSPTTAPDSKKAWTLSTNDALVGLAIVCSVAAVSGVILIRKRRLT